MISGDEPAGVIVGVGEDVDGDDLVVVELLEFGVINGRVGKIVVHLVLGVDGQTHAGKKE